MRCKKDCKSSSVNSSTSVAVISTRNAPRYLIEFGTRQSSLEKVPVDLEEKLGMLHDNGKF